MKTSTKLLIIFSMILVTNNLIAEANFTSPFSDTTKRKNNSDFELLTLEKKRNRIISAEVTSYYLWGRICVNYDVNLYQKNNYLIGGTVSLGLIGAKLGGYKAFRQKNDDLFKVEIGLGLTAGWDDGFFGPYTEFAYRSQRDTRCLYWEINAGYIVNTFESNASRFGIPYAGIAVGTSF